jgi:site-specific recombinase XerD
MSRSNDPRRRWLRLHEWPASCRVAWAAATAPGDDLDQPSYGRSLRPASLKTYARNFGRWLGFLYARGELDETVNPATLVTPARIAAYLRELQEMGYAAQSIVLALSGVSCAMRIFAPERDWRWIWAPNGVSLAPRLKGPRKEFPVPHPSELYEWGLRLMATAPEKKRARDRLAQYRDGLIVCLLGSRAVRRRSFVAMRLGEHLFKAENGWRIKFEPDDVKNRRWLEVSLPATLAPWIERYLTEIRPALLARRSRKVQSRQHHGNSDALWLSTDGSALEENSLSTALWNRSGRAFAKPFATHRFRHAIGTHAPLDDPTHPGLATALLAIGGQMHAKHYNRARDHVAEETFHTALREERAKALPLARRALRDRDECGQKNQNKNN